MKAPTASVACEKNKKRGKIPELQNARDAGKKGFLMAKGTTSKYDSSVTAARAFLKAVSDGKKAEISLNDPAGLDIDTPLSIVSTFS